MEIDYNKANIKLDVYLDTNKVLELNPMELIKSILISHDANFLTNFVQKINVQIITINGNNGTININQNNANRKV